MLETTNLECIRGGRRLFKDLSLSVRPGDFFQLTGPNGSGKTSLLRMLCRLLTPTSGEIRWRGADIRALGVEYSSSVTYLGHRPAVKEDLTADENLRVSSGLAGIPITRQHAMDVLERVGLVGRENLLVRRLSEGQRRRLALARLLVCRTPLWLLDEVTTALDSSAVESVQLLIGEHLDRGGMAIAATHHELTISASRYVRIELAA